MRARGGKFTDWEGFISKFEAKKTTDDCYTPANVYDVVVDYVFERARLSPDTEVVRPFYPGGNYEAEEYPEGCVVIDNPPFSILAKIVRFYIARNIRFFLFAPTLTLFSSSSLCTKIVCGGSIAYANKAKVATSFLTNVFGDNAIIVDAELTRRLKEANDMNAKPARELRKIIYPDTVVSAAILQKLAKHVSLTLPAAEIVPIKSAGGISIFGGGYLLSERAAAERAAAERAAAERAAAERAAAERAAAERAAAERISLLPQEEAIVRALTERMYGNVEPPFKQLELF